MIATLHQIALGYDDQGDGPPMVFLHGFPHDRTLWAHQRTALASRARCIVPDLRGFGESAQRAPYTMDQYADDVIALLDWLEVDDAFVCGLSMGGYVAMAMWRRHPERIRGLVLCDTRATADTDAARATRDEMIALVQTSGAEAIAAKQLPGMVGKSSRAERPAIDATMMAMMSRQSVAGIVGGLGALRDRPDSQSTLASITVPTLVVVGEEDVLTPVRDAQAMIDLLPPAATPRLERIAGAGHVSCLERPAAVNFVLAEFLASTTF
jgi:pimeloyl-ACP methyl ester carboxylesterase